MSASGKPLLSEESKHADLDYVRFRHGWHNPPAKIWCTKKSSDKAALVEHSVSVEEIEKAKKFQWVEGIIVSDKLRAEVATLRKNQQPHYTDFKLLQYYLENIETINDRISLFENEDKDLGYATFTRNEFQQNEVFGFYAGEFLNDTLDNLSLYRFVCDVSDCPSKEYVTDAEKMGNMARFIPHLITDQELAQAKLPPEIDRSQIATRNLKVESVVVENLELYVVVTTQKIPAKQVAGLSYMHEYWKNKEFWLFNHTGEKIIKVKYEGKTIVAAEPYQLRQGLSATVPPHVTEKETKKRLRTQYESSCRHPFFDKSKVNNKFAAYREENSQFASLTMGM